jgi:hypothetical protein
LAAFLIHSAIAYRGADGQTHFMSDHSLLVTFWTASAIMVVALLLAVYYRQVHAASYSDTDVGEAT